jgi:hypothetical protein
MSTDFDQRFNDLDSQLSELSVQIEAEQARLALNATQFEVELSLLDARLSAARFQCEADLSQFEALRTV